MYLEVRFCFPSCIYVSQLILNDEMCIPQGREDRGMTPAPLIHLMMFLRFSLPLFLPFPFKCTLKIIFLFNHHLVPPGDGVQSIALFQLGHLSCGQMPLASVSCAHMLALLWGPKMPKAGVKQGTGNRKQGDHVTPACPYGCFPVGFNFY